MAPIEYEEDAEPVSPLPSPRRAVEARPRLELAFRPRRAGTNVTSAAVDYELVIGNTGDAPARDIRIGLQLLTAGDHHDAELRTFFAAPVERPMIAPFDLAPGESTSAKAMVMLPKAAINVVTVKGRPMFVPMIAVNALYSWGDASGQTASSHVIGIERGEGEKMRPFWLDVTPRMHAEVVARNHAVTVQT